MMLQARFEVEVAGPLCRMPKRSEGPIWGILALTKTLILFLETHFRLCRYLGSSGRQVGSPPAFEGGLRPGRSKVPFAPLVRASPRWFGWDEGCRGARSRELLGQQRSKQLVTGQPDGLDGYGPQTLQVGMVQVLISTRNQQLGSADYVKVSSFRTDFGLGRNSDADCGFRCKVLFGLKKKGFHGHRHSCIEAVSSPPFPAHKPKP